MNCKRFVKESSLVVVARVFVHRKHTSSIIAAVPSGTHIPNANMLSPPCIPPTVDNPMEGQK